MVNKPQAINFIVYDGVLNMTKQSDTRQINTSYFRLDINALATFQPTDTNLTIGDIEPFFRSLKGRINATQFFNFPIETNNTNSFLIGENLRYQSLISYSLNFGNPADAYSTYNRFSRFDIEVDYTLIPDNAGLLSSVFNWQIISGDVGVY